MGRELEAEEEFTLTLNVRLQSTQQMTEVVPCDQYQTLLLQLVQKPCLVLFVALFYGSQGLSKVGLWFTI